MSSKRTARFQAVPWHEDEFIRIVLGIHASPTLHPGDKVKAGELLELAHRALSGKATVDLKLRMAAYLMGYIDIWNELVTKHSITQAEAHRMISRRLRGLKSPRAIEVALNRPMYAAIRAKVAADPNSVSCLVPENPETSPAFAAVWAMVYAGKLEAIAVKGHTDLDAWIAARDAGTPKARRKSLPRAARGGTKISQ